MTALLSARPIQAQHIILATNAYWEVEDMNTLTDLGAFRAPFGSGTLLQPSPNKVWLGQDWGLGTSIDLSEYDLSTVMVSYAIHGIMYSGVNGHLLQNASDTTGWTTPVSLDLLLYTNSTHHLVQGSNSIGIEILAVSGNDHYFGMVIYGNKTNECNVGVLDSPNGKTDVVGSTETFQALASGQGPLNYQWRRNGTALSEGYTAWGTYITGATNATLTLTSIATNDNGSYTVVLDNGCPSSATSSSAVLQVVTSILTSVQFGEPFYTTKSGAAVIGTTNDIWNQLFTLDVKSDYVPDPEEPSGWVNCLDTTGSIYSASVVLGYITDAQFTGGTYGDPVLSWGIMMTNSLFSDPLFNSYVYTAQGSDFVIEVGVCSPGTYDFYFYMACPGGGFPVTIYGPSSSYSMDGTYLGAYSLYNNYVVFSNVTVTGGTVQFIASSWNGSSWDYSVPSLSGMQIYKH